MGHHYVPQFYLKGFTDGNSIWVHDRAESRSFKSQPKAVANEKKLYTEELESQLANEIEYPAIPAIQKVRERRLLIEADRLVLAKYLIALWKRVPEGRLRYEENIPEVAATIQSEIHHQLSATADVNPSLINLAQTRKEEVTKILERYISEKPPGIWQQSLMKDSSVNVVASMLSMNWRFLCTDRLQFLTCDNPVFFFNHEGIGNTTSELIVPLSSSVTLWANRRFTNGPTYVSAQPTAVREVNRRMATNATRFVYSKSTEAWILPFVCKENYSLNRLV